METRIRSDEPARARGTGEILPPDALMGHTLRPVPVGSVDGPGSLLALSADILAVLSRSSAIVPACDAIALRLRTFFDSAHVVLGLVNPATRHRDILGFSSTLLQRDSIDSDLPEADMLAFKDAIDGLPQWFPDLDAAELNPSTDLARRAGIHSLIRAPFYLSDGSIGLVSVGSTSVRHFSEPDARDLLELCRPIGLAIDRLRLAEEMEHARRVLQAQSRVFEALGPGASLHGVAAVFVAEVGCVFEAPHALVALGADDGAVEVVAMSSDLMTEADFAGPWITGPDLRDPYLRALKGEPDIVDLSAQPLGVFEQRAFEKGLRSLMRVPILNRSGEVRGVVVIGSPVRNAWRPADSASLRQISGALGLVLERRELLATFEERDRTAARLTRILSTLDATAAPDDVARLIATEVRSLVGSDAVMIHEFDSDAGVRIRVALEGIDQYDHAPVRAPLSASTSYRGMVETASAVFDDRQPDASPSWLRDASLRLGMRSSVAIRLDGSTGPMGMLAVGSRQPGGFDDGAVKFLEAIVPPLAMLLERAKFVASFREQTNQSGAILDILRAIGPKENFTEVAGPIATAVRATYGADHCAIGVIERGQVMLAGLDSVFSIGWPLGKSTAFENLEPSLVLSGAVAHVFTDLQEPDLELSATSQKLRDLGMRSSMRVLVGPSDAPLAIVTVGSSEPGRYVEADAHRLAVIVHPLEVAVAYFRGKRDADLRAARLEAMNRVLVKLGAGGSPESLATGFLAECRALFDCEHASVHLADAGGGIRPLARDSILAPIALGNDDHAPLTRVGTAAAFSDLRTAHEQVIGHEEMIAASLFSGMEVPLIVRGDQIGWVSLGAAGTDRFTQDDLDTLTTLTRPLAISLERARAVSSLAESELKYRSLVDQAEEMIFLFDGATLQFLDANRYTERALGYTRDELLALTVDKVVNTGAEDVRATVRLTIQQGEVHFADREYRRKDGSLMDVDVIASLVTFGGREAVLALVRDVSERKAMQAQLMQSQKMESLGQMAGNLSHDFNNLLTTILGFAGLLKRSPNMDIDERENLALIEDAARRAADLTGRLLAFARGGLVRFGPVDLRAVVDDTLRLAAPALHGNLEVTTTLPADSVKVEGDASQIQQALLNIVLNAKDAMPEGGSIAVTLRAGDEIATISVADNGPGMSAETRRRIFEPFYTTKPIGSGTGLGMAITYGIVQGHHGDINLESTLGVGTTFTITLPLLISAGTPEEGASFNPGDGNLILVVDDDAMVRRTTSATLAELGYNVVEAPGGATAVQVVKARPDRISAVLLDLVMPGMTGSETFRALTSVRPDLPVIVCTGYAADAHIDIDVKRRIAGLVQKPFTAERLGRALAEAGVLPTRR